VSESATAGPIAKSDGLIYFDHAATAGLRPESVGQAMLQALQVSANPGRSAHRLSLQAARLVEETREDLAALLGIRDSAQLVFTKNATEAINLCLLGFLREGDTVLVGAYEHNAVMRPLRALARERSIRLEFLSPAESGPVDLSKLGRRLRQGPVRVLALTAASNVTGEISPLTLVGALCREHGTAFLVDAAQGAGLLDLEVERDYIDFLALTGHKSLFGPQGTGALYLREPEAVEPLIRGGTGSRSEEEEHPSFAPDRFEAGTINVPGLAGLGAGVREVRAAGLARLRQLDLALTAHLLARLGELPAIVIHGPAQIERRIAVVSFTFATTAGGVVPTARQAADPVHRLEDPAWIARELDRRGVLCRPGLHCAARAHRTLGTFPTGTVRFSLSTSNTLQEIDRSIEALREILREVGLRA
jgi:cysteine desulfurase / selenocysteine lyase